MRIRLVQAVAVAVLALASMPAAADPNDFQLRQLGNPIQGGALYNPAADAEFRAFAREFGAALTQVNLAPPETLGYAGFAVNAELSVVNLRNRTDLAGTDKFILPTERPHTGSLLIPSLHVRKGLPFSFELGARVAWIEKSRMAAATGELKWAVNEGFEYLPDVGVRGFITRLVNTRDFDLTAGGADLGVGKRFALGGMVTLTPYAGWALTWVSATSRTIDFRPERSQAESIANPTAQLQDTSAYLRVRAGSNAHNRFYGGVRFIGGVVQLGLEYSIAVLGKIQTPSPSNPGENVDRSLPPVSAFNATLGLDF